MRGQRALFNDYVTVPELQVVATEGTGRDPELLKRRDELLGARYYYYVYLRRLTYDEAFVNLRTEFCLATITMQNRLLLIRTDIERLRDDKTTAEQLQKKYPWLIWSVPQMELNLEPK